MTPRNRQRTFLRCRSFRLPRPHQIHCAVHLRPSNRPANLSVSLREMSRPMTHPSRTMARFFFHLPHQLAPRLSSSIPTLAYSSLFVMPILDWNT